MLGNKIAESKRELTALEQSGTNHDTEIAALKKEHLQWATEIATLKDQELDLKLSSERYGQLRQHFLSMYRRKAKRTLSDEDRRIMKEANTSHILVTLLLMPGCIPQAQNATMRFSKSFMC